MLDPGLTRMALNGVVALVVLGPERLRGVARTVGALFGRAQRYVNDVKAEVTHIPPHLTSSAIRGPSTKSIRHAHYLREWSERRQRPAVNFADTASSSPLPVSSGWLLF
jgi:Sec-independent protein translocase protein TatA